MQNIRNLVKDALSSLPYVDVENVLSEGEELSEFRAVLPQNDGTVIDKKFNDMGRTLLEKITTLLQYRDAKMTIQAILDRRHSVYQRVEACLSSLKVSVKSVHLFFSKKGSISFPRHKDTEPVIMYVREGVKIVDLRGTVSTVSSGDWLYVPRDAEHQVWNLEDSLLYSIGVDSDVEDRL